MFNHHPDFTILIARERHDALLRAAGHGRPLHESHRTRRDRKRSPSSPSSP